MSTILFSPVGGTDPISQTNLYDGSMLHITRVYKPDKIILYISKEMLNLHRQDNRYLYCLNQLFQLQGRENVVVETIERPELADVQEYDYFYRDFGDILSRIQNEMAPGDRLLVNVASGTPAMKSALLVLITLLNAPFSAIQVSTPSRRMNEHNHQNYDVKTCWELNEDNRPDFVDRTSVIKCPTLENIQTQNIIHRHILAYDYQAALHIAKSLPVDQTKSYMDYLEMAAARYTLSNTEDCRLKDLTGYTCYPYKKEEDRKLFEYLLGVQVRLQRKEYADYIRSLTPAIMQLFLRILGNCAGLDPRIYTVRTNDKLCWNEAELEKNGLSFFIRHPTENNQTLVYSRDVLTLILHRASNPSVIKLCEELRSVETNIRNMVAHDIIEVTSVVIRNKTGYEPEEIMTMLKKACVFAGIPATSTEWSSYDQMNDVIISHMDM